MGGHIAPVSIVMMVSSFQFRVVEDTFVPRLFSRAGPMFFVNVDHFLCASVYGGGPLPQPKISMLCQLIYPSISWNSMMIIIQQ